MSGDITLSLGEYLRQERERRGITIEQVASATKIGVKTLHALEADEYVELPAKPFVRGFVTSYVRFIGLDPKEILTRFGDFIDSRAHDRPNREAGHSGYAFEKREGDQSRTVLWMVMGGFVVAGGLAAVFIKKPLGNHHHSQGDKLRQAYGVAPSPVALPSPLVSVTALAVFASSSPLPSPLPSPTASAVVAQAVPTPSPVAAIPTPAAPVPAPVATPSATAPVPPPVVTITPEPAAASTAIPSDEGPNPEDPLNSGVKLKLTEIKHKVVFKATERAWVRYQADHRPVTTFVIQAGKTLVLRAREGIKFQVSPPKALSFSYKGSGYKPILGDQHLVTRQNDATLFFPFELAKTVEVPFPGERPLSAKAVPPPRAAATDPSPSP